MKIQKIQAAAEAFNQNVKQNRKYTSKTENIQTSTPQENPINLFFRESAKD